jgi:hypothetical protein
MLKIYIDPINGKELYVKSICRPTQSLLQGMPYHKDSYILAVPSKPPVPFKPLLLK